MGAMKGFIMDVSVAMGLGGLLTTKVATEAERVMGEIEGGRSKEEALASVPRTTLTPQQIDALWEDHEQESNELSDEDCDTKMLFALDGNCVDERLFGGTRGAASV